MTANLSLLQLTLVNTCDIIVMLGRCIKGVIFQTSFYELFDVWKMCSVLFVEKNFITSIENILCI